MGTYAFGVKKAESSCSVFCPCQQSLPGLQGAKLSPEALGLYLDMRCLTQPLSNSKMLSVCLGRS